jgi:hypothetical protein
VAVLGAAAAFSAPHATAEESPPYSGPGVLRLHLSGTAGAVTFEREGEVVARQTISSTRCEVKSTGPELLTFTPSVGKVGVVSSGLGVRTKNNCNTDNGRIRVGQWLKVELGADLDTGMAITEARMDIEGKFGAQLNVALNDVEFATLPISSSSDNGPDSGPGDNSQVIVGPAEGADPFQSITLSPSVGAVSLEGGGDYSPTPGLHDTVFILDSDWADALDCGQTLPAAEIGGSALTAEITRLGNEDQQTCDVIGVNFEILDEGVLLEKTGIGLNSDELQDVRAEVTIYWTPFTPVSPTPWRQINYTPDDPNTWVNVQWCQTQVDGHWTHPTEAWCLVSDESILKDGKVEQVQVYAGSGDPMWK